MENKDKQRVLSSLPDEVRRLGTDANLVLLPSFGIRRWSFYDNHGLFSKPIYILNFPYFVSI